jgi:hypothetical protein
MGIGVLTHPDFPKHKKEIMENDVCRKLRLAALVIAGLGVVIGLFQFAEDCEYT